VEDAFLTTANIILENIDRGEYDLTNEVRSLVFSHSLIQSIGIKPGNALPMYAATGADKKRRQGGNGKQLSNQKSG